MFQTSAPSPEAAREQSKAELKDHIIVEDTCRMDQDDPIKQPLHLPHLHVFHLVDLLMSSLPAFSSGRGHLEIQIVAVDRSAAIECRWLPQDHDGGVTDLQRMKTNRSTLENK